MTRGEFDNINNWTDLLDLADTEGYEGFEDIYSADALDEYVDDRLVYWAQDRSWSDLRDLLNDIPTYDGYFRIIYDDEFYELDNYGDLDEAKDDLGEWLEGMDFFCEEDDSEETGALWNEHDEPQSDPAYELSFDAMELFNGAFAEIKTVELTEEDDDEAEALIQMLSMA